MLFRYTVTVHHGENYWERGAGVLELLAMADTAL